MNPLLAWIAIVQGLAYVSSCFAAGIVFGNKPASICALISMGVAYLSTIALIRGKTYANFCLSSFAIIAGIASLLLLVSR